MLATSAWGSLIIGSIARRVEVGGASTENVESPAHVIKIMKPNDLRGAVGDGLAVWEGGKAARHDKCIGTRMPHAHIHTSMSLQAEVAISGR
eukprot:15445336-Alexandrium_andersonii.AAC.1